VTSRQNMLALLPAASLGAPPRQFDRELRLDPKASLHQAIPSPSSFTGGISTAPPGQWCPVVCPVSESEELSRLRRAPRLKRAPVIGNNKLTGIAYSKNLTWFTDRFDFIDSASPPKCNLCDTAWLFLISLGGRTGSTTLLNMLNAHPLIRLAGENNGAMLPTTARWKDLAADNYKTSLPKADSAPMARKPVQPMDILCDEQSEFKEFAQGVRPTPPPTKPIRGFKEIHWTVEAIQMLDVLFPCNRKVFNVRNTTKQEASHQEAFDGTPTTAFATEDTMEGAYELFLHDQATGNGWRSFWLALPDQGFEASQYNLLLHWLGEDGCSFTGVVHANDGAFNSTSASWEDAAKMLTGECQLLSVTPS